jgi:hypothetical protein
MFYHGGMRLGTDSELEAVLDEVAGHLNAQHARLVDATVAMLANPRWWAGEGVEKPQQFLCWRTAISPERARQIVSIAERAAELPRCMEHFRSGELAIDQMAAIAKRAPWWTDSQMAGLAARLTVGQLRRLLAQYPFPLIPAPADHDPDSVTDASHDEDLDSVTDASHDEDLDSVTDASHDEVGSSVPPLPVDGSAGDGDADARPGHDSSADDIVGTRRESLWFGWDDDGRFRLNLEAAADTGLVIEQALREARDRLFHTDDGQVDWVDAMRDVAERSLDQIDGDARRDRYRISTHLDVDGELSDRNGRWLPDAIRRHIGCDGTLSPVFYENGVPISVGRTQRVIPPRLRREVTRRDGGICTVPGCGCDLVIEVHHIVHWEDGGVTESWNLICLCPYHHRVHHRGDLGIHGNADEPDGVVFTNRHGRVIASTGARPVPPGAPPPPPTGEYRHPLGERVDTWSIEFTEPRHSAA